MELLFLAGFMACFILSAFSMEISESIAHEVFIAAMSSIIWPYTIWRLIHATHNNADC